jgi:hypothetical protein
MNFSLSGSRQPTRVAWSLERLQHERAIALGFALEPSSIASYSSALHSYINFCRIHQFPIEPSSDTLSFYVVYMCHHIKPTSVKSYLSGICNQLETFYPSVRETRRSNIVTRTLTGCTKLRATPISRKRAISHDEIISVTSRLSPINDHDTKLFIAIASTSFFGLMRIGENVWPDNPALRDYRKVIKRSSVSITIDSFSFLLPSHKADRLFQGNKILIHSSTAGPTAISTFCSYVLSRDRLFPFNPELWLRADGSIPSRRWFLSLSRSYFGLDTAGHSFRPGGATFYAIKGTPFNIIQGMGRWKSEAFQTYIRVHPSLLAAFIFSSNNIALPR